MSQSGQLLPYIVSAEQPFEGPLQPETCPSAYESNSTRPQQPVMPLQSCGLAKKDAIDVRAGEDFV